MGDCIFCSIASGAVPSARVYEDDQVFAFLDINPLAEGHVLVIPRAHVAKLGDCEPADASAVMAATCRIVPAACAAAGVEDATVAINDGPDAGQEVPHLHVHIVPRRPGDAAGPIHALFKDRPVLDEDAMARTAAAVKANLEAA